VHVNRQGHLVESAAVTANVNGMVDAGGDVQFVYKVSEAGYPNGVWRVEYEGTGSFATNTQASGVASFTHSCASGSEDLYWCNNATSEEFTGTIPWSFNSIP